MSARDVLAASLWLIDREIAGAPLPHPSWETFRENDPETAMIYETQAGCHLSALSAAGYAVVPREPTTDMLQDGQQAGRKARRTSVSGMTIDAQVRAECAVEAAIYRAMIAAQEDQR